MNNQSIDKRVSMDDRIVDFSVIHNQKQEDFQKFVEIIDAQPEHLILAGMDGYGAAAKKIIENATVRGFVPEIYTLDQSKVQVELARKNIPNIEPDHLINSDMRETPFPDNMFDRVVIKMGIHEVPKDDQIKILREVYRILKPGGKFITWDLSFHDSETQIVFQDLIRKKDEIAGFDTLIANRYFPRQDELISVFKESGFKNVEVAHEVDAHLSMRVRETELVSKDRRELLETKSELTPEDEQHLAKLGKKRCTKLVDFAKQYMASVPDEIRKRLLYEETKDDINLTPSKEIIVGYKL